MPFFLRCHSAAILGKITAREFVILTLNPLQYGQSFLPLVLVLIVASHSCPHIPNHQTFLWELKLT